MASLKKGEVDPENVIPITMDKLTPEQKAEFEKMKDDLQNRFLHSFAPTRSGTMVQKYKVVLSNKDDVETSSGKDDKAKGDNQEEDLEAFKCMQDQADYSVTVSPTAVTHPLGASPSEGFGGGEFELELWCLPRKRNTIPEISDAFVIHAFKSGVRDRYTTQELVTRRITSARKLFEIIDRCAHADDALR
uniref:Uncharacterized protein n=1 Tax=Oryza sativa subsp. japonica TaxID=39947 RepID=Q5VMF4_ORYSJ|nr:hypothetical protein [Oryza sativa Japonica Group]